MKYVIMVLLIAVPCLMLAEQIPGLDPNTTVEIKNVSREISVKSDNPNGYAPRANPRIVFPEDLPDPSDPTSGEFSNQGINPKYNPFFDPGNPGGGLEPRWNADILVYGDTPQGIDFDEDEVTGYLYAVVDLPGNDPDSCLIFRSTNGGESWGYWWTMTNTDGYITNPKIRVARDGSGNTWICSMGIWWEDDGRQILWMRRNDPGLTGGAWESVHDTVDYADLDAGIGTGARAHVVYMPDSPTYDFYMSYNALGGGGWVAGSNSVVMDTEINPYPQIAAGAGGHIAVAFLDDRQSVNDQIRIKRSTNYGSSWIQSEQVGDNTGAYDLTHTDIAYAHSTPFPGWIFATYDVGSSLNLAYYYTTDNGVNWTYGTVIGGGENEDRVSLRARKASGAVTAAFKKEDGDSVMFTWASAATPTNFSAPVRINDYTATGTFGPVAGWCTTTGGYSAIMYAEWGPVAVWYDYFGNTGVEQNPGENRPLSYLNISPNPSRGLVRLSYSLRTPGMVNIGLYNATGRLVKTVFNGNREAGAVTNSLNVSTLPQGVYFIKAVTPDATFSERLSVIK